MATGSAQSTRVAAADGAATIAAARSGYTVRLLGCQLTAFAGGGAWPDGAVATATFVDGAGNTLSGPHGLRESAPLVIPVAPQTETEAGGWFSTAPGQALLLNVAGATVSGVVTWRYDPA